MKENIYFYFTNDLHSDFTYWPHVVSHLNQAKKQREHHGESYFIVDVGDHVDRVNPIAEAFMGKGNVKMLNNAGYDIVTIGNNEGITLAHDELYHLYDEANFSVVCSNLQTKTDRNPSWLESIVKVESHGGTKISVIGLTAPFNAFYHLLDWHVENPHDVLKEIVTRLNETTDIIVLLSHLGINEDRMIAEKFPQIDTIIGGHTHHLLKTGEKVNNTIITAAGKYCSHVGEVILTWDHDRHKLINNQANVNNITDLEPDEQTKIHLQDIDKRAKEKLSSPILHTNKLLLVNWFQETEVIKKLTKVLLEWTEADCAMLNAGLLLESFHAGEITYEDVHRICPHPINPVVVQLTGNELKEVIRVSQTEEFMHLQLKGFGFRGKVIGKMIFAGLDIDVEELQTGEQYVKNIFIGEQRVEDNQLYSVATADMFMFGRLLPGIAKSPQKHLFLPEFIRDLLVHTLRNKL